MAATARQPAHQHAAPARAPFATPDHAPLDARDLLTAGGDERIVLDEDTGANRYGCGPRPDSALAAFGSSTASVISPVALAAAQRLTARLAEQSGQDAGELYREELDRVRGRLGALLGLTDIAGLKTVISPSGTDLHRIALCLTAAGTAAPPLVIVPEPHETGSGVIAALGGQVGPTAALRASILARTPEDALLQPQIMTAPSRRPDGTLRPAHQIDEEIAAIATAAARAGRRVMLVMMDVSKTGLVSPSVACAQDLKQRFPETVDVLVDACQLRLAPATLAAYLRNGFMVAVTGSKFMTGPAFSAALLVPPALAQRIGRARLPGALSELCLEAELPNGWNAPALDRRANLGLLVRWEAALEEMRRFTALPCASVTGFFERFAAAIGDRLADDAAFEPLAVRDLERTGLGAAPAWDRVQTIFPFLLKSDGKPMSPVETLGVHRMMTVDLGEWSGWAPAAQRSSLGQPVAVGHRDGQPVTAVRLCLSARLAVEALTPGRRGEAMVIGEALQALDKAAWLAARIAGQ